MANILIAYASGYGHTETIARHIGAVLRSCNDAVDVIDTDAHSQTMGLQRYQAVIVAAPIHAGGYPPSVVRFVQTNVDALNATTSVFCSVGLAVASRTSNGRAQTQPIVDAFLKKTGWQPTRVQLVAGALAYSKYNMLVKFIMRRIAKHEGGDTDTSHDYVYTDWAAIDRMASELSTATNWGQTP
jgi:menaquinone-dependent protoporphyrinogen oxidase